ncbi:lysozyme inhibitor LprI family protein [Sphingomonas sp. dw_22]|uniref:lysozyme inhibitor LprI family protein n=1 Tax=Sphingomonas sp. dw_22 TaxID=2721175 RepID=UPI001BD5E2B8
MILFAAAILLQDWHPAPCTDKSERGDIRCAQRDLAKAERAMGTVFSQAIFRLQHCTPRNSTSCYNRPRAIKLLQAEQRTWLAWRNAHCDVVAFGMEGTSGEIQVRSDCRTGLTVARTKELQEVGHR